MTQAVRIEHRCQETGKPRLSPSELLHATFQGEIEGDPPLPIRPCPTPCWGDWSRTGGGTEIATSVVWWWWSGASSMTARTDKLKCAGQAHPPPARRAGVCVRLGQTPTEGDGAKGGAAPMAATHLLCIAAAPAAQVVQPADGCGEEMVRTFLVRAEHS